MREISILASVFLAVAVFGILNRRFIGIESATTILEGASTDGLMVVGMTIVIVCGAFDMSVGSQMALCGLVAAMLMKAGAPVPIAVLFALLTGLLAGFINGTVVTKLKINPFITTLGTMSIFRGIVLVVTKSNPPTGFPESFLNLAWSKVLGIPLPVVLLVLVIIAGDLFLRHLRYLRQVYYIGSNEAAARLTGIPTARVKTFAFVLTGFLAAMSGVLIAARSNAVDPNGGMGAELRVIAAVIVGGASLSGGRGTILGSFLGLMLMQIITTGLVFINVAPEAQLIAVGLVLVLAAVIDQAGSSWGSVVSLLTTTRSKKVERAINVVLAIVIVILAFAKFGGGAHKAAAPGVPPVKAQQYVMIAAATGAPYWIDSKAGLYDKAQELGVKAVFTGPQTVDVNQQIDAINRAIAQHVDGIIMVPMADSVTPAINKALDAGIPVVCADADAPSSRRYTFVGTGNYQAGRQVGELLSKTLGGEGEVALIYIPGADNLAQRLNGCKDALKTFPGIKVVAIGNDQGSLTEGQKVCRTIMQAHPDLKGFGCVDAGGGQGAAVAVKEANKIGKVHIVGMDRDEATLQFIEQGIIDASIGQRTYTMSYTALQLVYNLRNNQINMVRDWRKLGISPLPMLIDTGSFVITKDNVKEFYHK